MPSYKLTYFKGKGRAEIARLLFAYSGTAYEDERLEGESWQKFKPSTPYGQLPLLTVDGKMINQSGAIYRYIAREVGLYGKNNLESSMIDVMLETMNDMITELMKIFVEKDEEKRAEISKTIGETSIPKYLNFIEQNLKGNGGKCLVGSCITLADIATFDIIDKMTDGGPLSKSIKDCLNGYPATTAFINSVKSEAKIKKYLESRPATDF